jgi:hypothetical protein
MQNSSFWLSNSSRNKASTRSACYQLVRDAKEKDTKSDISTSYNSNHALHHLHVPLCLYLPPPPRVLLKHKHSSITYTFSQNVPQPPQPRPPHRSWRNPHGHHRDPRRHPHRFLGLHRQNLCRHGHAAALRCCQSDLAGLEFPLGY